MTLKVMAAIISLIAAVASPAYAKHYKTHHHRPQAAQNCVYSNSPVVVCGVSGKRTTDRPRVFDGNGNRVTRSNVEFIAHPEGCPRRLFCACGLAKFWGIWERRLNRVAEWPVIFPRTHGPSIGVAAVRYDRHHIMGIVGGQDGAWEVVDFNSGNHLSRRYIVSSFRGYFFIDPRSRTALR